MLPNRIPHISGHGFTTTSLVGSKRKIVDHDNLREGGYRTRVGHFSLAPTHAAPKSKLTASLITSTDPQRSMRATPHAIVQSTPGPSQDPRLSLSHPVYGLPSQLVRNLEDLGIQAIYPWQAACLQEKSLLDGHQHFIYAAPTGGGKSLVADILMLKRVIDHPGSKAILVLPYVALVQEKTKWLRRVVEDVQKTAAPFGNPKQGDGVWIKPTDPRIRVAAMYGGSKAPVAWNDCDIAVCTIEKANMLINTAIQEGQIGDLRVVVFDELHMLDDEHRGYIMEIMITKLIYTQLSVQIIGMSATIANPKLLADWLQAKFYVSNYRPIPIEEFVVHNNAIYSSTNSSSLLRTAGQPSQSVGENLPVPRYTIATSAHKELKSPDLNAVVALAVETATAGFGALVFVGSKLAAETVAKIISDAVPSDSFDAEDVDKRLDVVASLQALGGGFETVLSHTIPAGVAIHHAGLTAEERDIVAQAYDDGILKIMIATCSLAAGINLPARRVILYGAKVGRELLGPAMLRQMRGRAGRKGKDEVGQTFLCCRREELHIVADLLEAELPPVVSCLVAEKRGLVRAVLEILGTRLASNKDSLQTYVQQSLLWQTADEATIGQMLDSAIQFLQDNKLIESIADDAFVVTRIGAAVVASGFTPHDGLFVHGDLRRALSSFSMDNDLHLFYLFTPLPQASGDALITSDISWPVFRDAIDRLDEASTRALHLIGVSPAAVNKMAHSGSSGMKETTAQELNTARVYRRMYSTFALRDFCNEVPISTIAATYNIPRGQVQTLAQTCHGFAAGMIKFCQRLSTTDPSPDPLITSSGPTFPVFSTAAALVTSATSARSGMDPNASGFSMLGAVLEHMQDRLRAGARADLLEMAQVTFVKGHMARILYANGFKGVRALAHADAKKDILPIMLAVNGWKIKSISRATALMNIDQDTGDVAGESAARDEFELQRSKLERKLLAKAEILVQSANKIWERECLRQTTFDED